MTDSVCKQVPHEACQLVSTRKCEKVPVETCRLQSALNESINIAILTFQARAQDQVLDETSQSLRPGAPLCVIYGVILETVVQVIDRVCKQLPHETCRSVPQKKCERLAVVKCRYWQNLLNYGTMLCR